MSALPNPLIRQMALDLAHSPAWTQLVRPEIDRLLKLNLDSFLSSAHVGDRELADARERYLSLQTLLSNLHNEVLGACSSLSLEEQAVFSPELRATLLSVFAPPEMSAASQPASPPRQPEPIVFPETHQFNPFSSQPPPESPTSAT